MSGVAVGDNHGTPIECGRVMAFGVEAELPSPDLIRPDGRVATLDSPLYSSSIYV